METLDTRWFYKERNEQFECAREITGQFKSVVIDAPIKCGKREIVICCSLLKDQKTLHIYTVNLTRKDCEEQLEELNSYNILTFVGKNIRTRKNEILETIKNALNQGLTVYLHVDEADYGSGIDQCYSDLLLETRDLPVRHVFYSATSQELLYATGFDFVKINFVPHPSYRGTKYFFDHDLVHKAEESFFVYDDKGNLVLSSQGEECCRLIDIKKGKNIGVVRITTQENQVSMYQSVKQAYGITNSSIRKSLDKVFGKNNYVVKFTDQSSSLFWGDRDKNTKSKSAWYDLPTNKPVLHIINQTSNRSTEWALQPYLAFYHSYRKGDTFLSTILQYDTRMFGYREVDCHIYTQSVEGFRVPIEDENYLAKIVYELGIKISCRVKNTGGVGKSGRAKPGSYDLHLLFEGVTPDLQIYEHDDPIHKKNSKKDDNPSIRYKGHFYGWCNRVSNWGNSDTTNRSNLAYFLLNKQMALSKSSDLTFAMIDRPSDHREEWRESFESLYSLDHRIKETLDAGRRVFGVYIRKKQSDIATKDTSLYSEFAKSVDPFTE